MAKSKWETKNLTREDIEDLFIEWSDNGVRVDITNYIHYYSIGIYNTDIDKVRKCLKLAKRRYKFKYSTTLWSNYVGICIKNNLE